LAPALAFGAWCCAVTSGAAFQSDAMSWSRTLDKTVALTNTPIVVTSTFTNGDAWAVRGFCYSEQLPSGLTATSMSVVLNGSPITNYTVESGMDGDVLAGCTPWRWVLELPDDFVPANPLAPQSTVQVIYSITASQSGSFTFQQSMWFAADLVLTNACFGYGENSDQQTVNVYSSDTPASLSSVTVSNGVCLTLTGQIGARYVLEYTTNMASWIFLQTNTAPFSYTDTNRDSDNSRFYRGRWLP
jgi:hypothetical protein